MIMGLAVVYEEVKGAVERIVAAEINFERDCVASFDGEWDRQGITILVEEEIGYRERERDRDRDR